MKGYYYKSGQLGCLVSGLLIIQSALAEDIPITSVGHSNPFTLIVHDTAWDGKDINGSELIQEITQPYQISIRTLMNEVNEWKERFGERGHYQLYFIPNKNLEAIKDEADYTIFKASEYLGVAFRIQDANFDVEWIKDSNDLYCIITTSKTQNKCNGDYFIDNGGYISLKLDAKIFYLPSNNPGSKFDPNSDQPYLDEGEIYLGKGVLKQKWCGIFCEDFNNKQIVFDWFLKYSVKINPQSCYLDPSQLNQTIDMHKVTTQALNDHSGIQSGEPIRFDFKCPKNADIAVTLHAVDESDPSNTSSYLTLSSTSTAEGVKLGLKDDKGRQLYYSPDFNHVNQLEPIFKSAYQTSMSYRLWPYYAKRGTVKAGSVNARIRFRLNYK